MPVNIAQMEEHHRTIELLDDAIRNAENFGDRKEWLDLFGVKKLLHVSEMTALRDEEERAMRALLAGVTEGWVTVNGHHVLIGAGEAGDKGNAKTGKGETGTQTERGSHHASGYSWMDHMGNNKDLPAFGGHHMHEPSKGKVFKGDGSQTKAPQPEGY